MSYSKMISFGKREVEKSDWTAFSFCSLYTAQGIGILREIIGVWDAALATFRIIC